MSRKTRTFKYDFIRAFAIITVIANHIFTKFDNTQLDYEIKEYLNTVNRFSVPIFLFLSGIFFHRNVNRKYLKNKVLRVLIPYSVVSIPATAFLIWRYDWSLSNIPEIISSYLFGYKFGYYFIFIILMMYFIGYGIVKRGKLRNINKWLLVSAILHFGWLAIDERFYSYFELEGQSFLQFNVNDFIFYHNPLTWSFFFILGLWYQKETAKDLVKKSKDLIIIALIATFGILNYQIFTNTGDYTPYGSIIWSLFSVLITFFLLNINYVKCKGKNVITYLSKNAFSIFLIHYFFIYILIELEKSANLELSYAMNLVFFPVITLLSIIIIEIIKRIFKDKSKYIIGI